MRGMDGLTGRGGPEGMDAADLFAQFFAGAGGPAFGFDFGQGAGGPRRQRGKGDDSVIPHEVTLEDLYIGKSVKMNMSKEAVCAPCKGYLLFTPPYSKIANVVAYKIWSPGERKA